MTRWSSILGQDEQQQANRRSSSWLDKHGRDQRSFDLRALMDANSLSPEDVGSILRRSPKTVKYWLIGGQQNIPTASMNLLRIRVASMNLEQEITDYQKHMGDSKNQLSKQTVIA